MKAKPISVIIADNQYLITYSIELLLQRLPQFSLLATVQNRADLQTKLESHPEPLLLITDISLFDYDGFADLQSLRQHFPKVHWLILVNQITKNELSECTKIACHNIAYKTVDFDELQAAMEATMKQKKYYSPEVVELLMELNQNPSEQISLTASELEIVRCIANGLTTKEIAAKRFISFHTVMTHRKNIFRKLGINNAPELLMYAIRQGLIDNVEYYI